MKQTIFPGGQGGGLVTGSTTFARCMFRNNEGNRASGGLSVEGRCSLTDCIFVGNATTTYGAAIGGGSHADLTLNNCTIIGNLAGSSVLATAGVYINDFASAKIFSSIIAWNMGPACRGIGLEFSCTDIFANSSDSLCGIDAGGNFSLDSQFCARDPVVSLNFGIQQDSPCAPGNNPVNQACGLMGRAPVACGAVAVEHKTWSHVKSLYGR